MKVLLQSDVPNLGKRGEVKEVKDGHARNFLIPRALAVPATDHALREQEQRVDQRKRAQEREQKSEVARAQRLKHSTLTFREKATAAGKLYGGIHRERIVQALGEQGIMIETQSIILKEPLKTIGSHQVEIHLNFGLKTLVTIAIIPLP